jgi:hypothetical protein
MEAYREETAELIRKLLPSHQEKREEVEGL